MDQEQIDYIRMLDYRLKLLDAPCKELVLLRAAIDRELDERQQTKRNI